MNYRASTINDPVDLTDLFGIDFIAVGSGPSTLVALLAAHVAELLFRKYKNALGRVIMYVGTAPDCGIFRGSRRIPNNAKFYANY